MPFSAQADGQTSATNIRVIGMGAYNKETILAHGYSSFSIETFIAMTAYKKHEEHHRMQLRLLIAVHAVVKACLFLNVR